jgi:hypothetical protein
MRNLVGLTHFGGPAVQEDMKQHLLAFEKARFHKPPGGRGLKRKDPIKVEDPESSDFCTPGQCNMRFLAY